jgi:TolA-binding protein
MSTFPPRLLDEPGDSPGRRLLERGRLDEPPPNVVAEAIAKASLARGASASTEAHSETSSPSVRPRASKGNQFALLAGALLVGGTLVALGSRSEPAEVAAGRSSAIATMTAPASTVTQPKLETGAVESAAVETSRVAEGMPSTSVANLPNAPRASAPPSSAPRTGSVLAAELPKQHPSIETADLLREANRLRAQGRWSEAAATYRKVIDLAPGSAEAYPADVALGNLELQQGRPLVALERYEHALASHPAGALGEEARWGKARSLRAAGRTTEERDALLVFQARHPESPLAAAAAQRLKELGN